jgi:hypothetical protein
MICFSYSFLHHKYLLTHTRKETSDLLKTNRRLKPTCRRWKMELAQLTTHNTSQQAEEPRRILFSAGLDVMVETQACLEIVTGRREEPLTQAT